MGTDDPFDLSRWTRSTWITHFLRYTWVTLPSRPLYFPRTMRTSSSLRIGSERVYDQHTKCVRSNTSRTYRASETHVVLAAELLRESGGHDLAADGRGGSEVRLARLAARGGDVCMNQSRGTYIRQHFVQHPGSPTQINPLRPIYIHNVPTPSSPFHPSKRTDSTAEQQDSITNPG